mmetsp:Transcript_49210/g.107027  ORF Transcript_49210/g.107027 Transcript_49210/m.107027 type:complete len:118 (-) Transcript_49210:320-673(-)
MALLGSLSEFVEGRGDLWTLMYRTAKFQGVRSVALMPYGMSFDCGKVVEAYKTVKVPVHYLASVGFFGRRKYQITYLEEKHPIFKTEVLNVRTHTEVKKALKHLAFQSVLESMDEVM